MAWASPDLNLTPLDAFLRLRGKKHKKKQQEVPDLNQD